MTSDRPFPISWSPGQHLALVGQTGSGKSTLAACLLSSWTYYLAVKTKDDDVTYPGAVKVVAGRKLNQQSLSRILLQPPYERQAREIHEAFRLVYRQGHWTCYVDEEWYVEEELGLTYDMNLLLTQGRSKKITMMMGAQRASRISRFVLSQATHVITFRLEGRDVKVIEEATNAYVADYASVLRRHEFVWWRRDEDVMWVGRLDAATLSKFEPVEVGQRLGEDEGAPEILSAGGRR